MRKFIIKNTKTGEYLCRASGLYSWSKSADGCLLINTRSAACNIASRQSEVVTGNKSWWSWDNKSIVKIIEVGVIIYPKQSQPFMDGVLNGNSN